jgi:hypothetical protein
METANTLLMEFVSPHASPLWFFARIWVLLDKFNINPGFCMQKYFITSEAMTLWAWLLIDDVKQI